VFDFTKRKGFELKTLNRIELKEFMIGTLLGDGALRRKNKNQNATYRESHPLKQKDYLLWKQDILEKNLDIEFFGKDFYNNHGTPCYKIDSRVHPYFTGLYDSFYPTRIPFELLYGFKAFNEFGLAVFYMDDGCTDWKKNGNINCCEIHIQNYSIDEAMKLQEFLKSRFNFQSKLALVKNNRPKLRIYGECGRHLLKMITPIVQEIPCMEYKVNFSKYIEFRKTVECPTSAKTEENVC